MTGPPATLNHFAVSADLAGGVHVLGLVVLKQRMDAGGLTIEESLNLAAWLVASANASDPEATVKFEKLYSAIAQT